MLNHPQTCVAIYLSPEVRTYALAIIKGNEVNITSLTKIESELGFRYLSLRTMFFSKAFFVFGMQT